jgi:hypothetical protein
MSARRISLAETAAKTAQAMDAQATAVPVLAPFLTQAPREDLDPITEAPPTTTGTPEKRAGEARQRKPKAPEAVRFDQLERKEARVRLDQYEALQGLSRQLNRSRNRRGERITENTLIRVAIDLLLSRQAEVAGTTEPELRESVGL